jgi:hypothetical protein
LVFVADSEALRALFVKTYAGMPNKLRIEIIAVVDEKPYNWDNAYIEVQGGTEVGNKILKHLNELGILR